MGRGSAIPLAFADFEFRRRLQIVNPHQQCGAKAGNKPIGSSISMAESLTRGREVAAVGVEYKASPPERRLIGYLRNGRSHVRKTTGKHR